MKKFTPHLPDSKERLYERARQGDMYALDELLRAHKPQLYLRIRPLARSAEDAEDIQTDVLCYAAAAVYPIRHYGAWVKLLYKRWVHRVAKSYYRPEVQLNAKTISMASLIGDCLAAMDPRVEAIVDRYLAGTSPDEQEVLDTLTEHPRYGLVVDLQLSGLEPDDAYRAVAVKFTTTEAAIRNGFHQYLKRRLA